MSCCGGKKTVIVPNKKIALPKAVHIGRQIVAGYAKALLRITPPYQPDRIYKCKECEEVTYMTKLEYATWLLGHGIDITKAGYDLEKVKELPKYQKNDKRKIRYCRICKCILSIKTLVQDAKCPLGKW